MYTQGFGFAYEMMDSFRCTKVKFVQQFQSHVPQHPRENKRLALTYLLFHLGRYLFFRQLLTASYVPALCDPGCSQVHNGINQKGNHSLGGSPSVTSLSPSLSCPSRPTG